jgi:hypothetical protein
MLRVAGIRGRGARLEEILVHAERRRGDARADVRHAGELEQPLDAPVLAEGPVQDREDDVGAADRSHGRRLGQPARAARELDRVDLVAAAAERGDDALGGRERDVVLARPAPCRTTTCVTVS